MIFIILFFLILILVQPLGRFIISHLFQIIFLAIIDLFKFFKYKKYNECKEFGKINCNCASGSQVFGCGKTLSLVRDINYLYRKYDNKDVFDYEKKEFVKQHIHIISNVSLFNIPYIKFDSEQQLIDLDKIWIKNGWGDHDIVFFLLDETGAIFNSRNFKTNISTEFLTKLLQSRKNKMSLFMTSQRFEFVDKILRESMSVVTHCRKIWRIVIMQDYDAFSLEHCSNPDVLVPLRTSCYIATDRLYNSYNTDELIEKLTKEDNYLSTEEILNCRGDIIESNFVTRLKKSYRNKRKV